LKGIKKEIRMNLKIFKAVVAGLILSVSGLANAGLITSIVVNNGKAPESYQISTLVEGVTSFVDRNYTYVNIPSLLLDADFIQVANDDKIAIGEFSIEVTLSEASYFYLFIDDRVFELKNEENFNKNMSWVADNGFTDTNMDINITEPDRTGVSSIFTKYAAAGITTTFRQQVSGGTNMYAIAAIAVPEPTTLAIFALGIFGLAARRMKKQSQYRF
jgi:hypothetical protein